MKAVILAGGFGTRLSEETAVRPKPMVEIGGRPILWHIMKIYGSHGISDFVICCGYKGSVIKDYFADYFLRACDITFHLGENRMEIHGVRTEPWRVTVVDTGDNTMTGGRIRRVREHVGNETFCLTYGDGVGDVNIRALIDCHRRAGRLASVTAVQPTGRFGLLTLEHEQVTSFQEKPVEDGAWINGGFFVLQPEAIGYIESDETVWEKEPMKRLASEGQMTAYRHTGFWQPMDSLRDKLYLENLWSSGNPPWKTWD